MVKSSVRIGIVALQAVLLCSTSAFAQSVLPPAAGPQGAVSIIGEAGGRGMEAMRRAAEARKYLFLFFYEIEDEQTRAMRPVFDATMQKVADKAEGLVINTVDPAERGVVAKFEVDRAPMPLVLALAPNGAITGGYPIKFDEQMLMDAFCSQSTWECLKALQEGKLVFLCIQNESIKFAAEAMKAVREVKADPKYNKVAEIVVMDPSDKTESDSVKRLDIPPDLDEAVTILLSPPVTIIKRFKGAPTKDAIIAEIQKASAGRGGCCPGSSCGPKPPPTGTPSAAAAGKPQPPAAAGVPGQGAASGAPQAGTGQAKAQPGSTTGKP